MDCEWQKIFRNESQRKTIQINTEYMEKKLLNTLEEQILQSIEGDEHSHTDCSFFCDEGEFIFSTEYVMTEKGEPAGEFTPEIQDTYEHIITQCKRQN